jgi:hypothetical protein
MMPDDRARSRRVALYLSVAAVAVAVTAGYIFESEHTDPPIVPAAGWTQTMLSDTLPSLKGTDGDTRVYTYDSGKPGGTFIVLGGTHPQEIGGLLAADLVVENAKVTRSAAVARIRSTNGLTPMNSCRCRRASR